MNIAEVSSLIWSEVPLSTIKDFKKKKKTYGKKKLSDDNLSALYHHCLLWNLGGWFTKIQGNDLYKLKAVPSNQQLSCQASLLNYTSALRKAAIVLAVSWCWYNKQWSKEATSTGRIRKNLLCLFSVIYIWSDILI